MNEEKEASLLANWLGQPGNDPPPGIDPEVLGAVYTLRPDLGPAPRVRLDDILSGVSAGPFVPAGTTPEAEARGEGGVGAGRPSREARVPSPTTKPVRRAERAVSVPWWRRTSVGVALAAGLAVVIVLPVALIQRSAPPDMVTAAPTMSRAGDVSPAAGSPSVSMIPEAGGDLAEAPSGDAQKEEEPARSAPLGGSGDQAIAAAGEPAAELAPAEPAPTELAAGGTQGAAPQGALVPLSPLPPPPPAPATTVADAASPIDRFDQDDAVGAAESVASPAPATSSATSGAAAKSAREETRAVVNEEMDEVVAREPARPAKSKGSTSPAAAPVSASSSTSASASATPWDYAWSWYTSYPDVVVVYDQALAAERSGKVADAVTAYRSLLGDTRSMVAQDAAWRAARLERQRGDNTSALALVEQGLRRSSANTVFRSNLLSLQGDLLVSLGRSADAERAWAEASRLNAGRR